jgi:hypothetical protein
MNRKGHGGHGKEVQAFKLQELQMAAERAYLATLGRTKEKK